MKKNKTNFGNGLLIVYLIMVLVCTYLMSTSKQSMENICITIAFFIIVAFIFISSLSVFRTIWKITQELKNATSKIYAYYEMNQELLWSCLKTSEEPLFSDGVLQQRYKLYEAEMSRLEKISDGTSRCNIEDYINQNYIDAVAKKNMFNLVPGTLTGLGILGTFIGLSLGLQDFAMGSSTEIAESMPSLMDGIKVAFHTSIYGMFFSLTYNFIYRHVMEDVYEEMDEFLDAFDRYVCPNVKNDAVSSIQTALKDIPNAIGNVLSPAFEKINVTLDKFSTDVSTKQLEGMSALIDTFIEEMNNSLGGSFKLLEDVIKNTCELQKDNGEMMKNILSEIDRMSTNIIDINEQTNRTVTGLTSYIENIEKLQRIINDNFMSLCIQSEEQQKYEVTLKGYIEELVLHEKSIREASEKYTQDMTESLERLNQMESEISNNTKANLEIITNKANEYSEQVADAVKKQLVEINNVSSNNASELEKAAQNLKNVSEELTSGLEVAFTRTFNAFDKELEEITMHLSGTIKEVEKETAKVPKTVIDAYEGISKGFREMEKQIDGLLDAMEIAHNEILLLKDKND